MSEPAQCQQQSLVVDSTKNSENSFISFDILIAFPRHIIVASDVALDCGVFCVLIESEAVDEFE